MNLAISVTLSTVERQEIEGLICLELALEPFYSVDFHSHHLPRIGRANRNCETLLEPNARRCLSRRIKSHSGATVAR